MFGPPTNPGSVEVAGLNVRSQELNIVLVEYSTELFVCLGGDGLFIEFKLAERLLSHARLLGEFGLTQAE